MTHHHRLTLAGILGLALVSPSLGQAPTRTPAKPAPKLQAVAETRLLMEALTHANFNGLEKILRSEKIDSESWTFARGQALLIAESANLLMLRPPKNAGQDAWMKASVELRDRATVTARAVAGRDVERSRIELVNLAGACNACHKTFRVEQRFRPFEN